MALHGHKTKRRTTKATGRKRPQAVKAAAKKLRPRGGRRR